MVLIPARGAPQPAAHSRGLSTAAGWQLPPAAPGRRTLSWESCLRPGRGGEWGQLFWAAPGAPAVVLAAAQSPGCSRDPGAALGSVRGGARFPWGPRHPAAPCAQQTSPGDVATLSTSEQLCSSQPGASRARGGTTAWGPAAKALAPSNAALVCARGCPRWVHVSAV